MNTNTYNNEILQGVFLQDQSRKRKSILFSFVIVWDVNLFQDFYFEMKCFFFLIFFSLDGMKLKNLVIHSQQKENWQIMFFLDK